MNWKKKIKENYKYLIIFGLITGIGIVVKFFYPKQWKWFEIIDTASAVALALLAFLGYMEYSKGEDDVELIFDVEGKREKTGFSILRKNFTRGEVLGVLGMIPLVNKDDKDSNDDKDGNDDKDSKDKKDKFSLEFTSNGDFLKAVDEIQKGKKKEFIIYMTKKEREQFKL